MKEPWLHRLLSRWFTREDINGADRCPTYLYRWVIFSTKRLGMYVHRFVSDDWSRDLHDHPKRFVSIGVWGSYLEVTPTDERLYRAPWVRTFPAEHIHRLILASPECWTIIFVFRATRAWGFWNDGTWIPFREYIRSELADKNKVCQ